MYGTSFDFSGVTLPGAGGMINGSNSIGMDRLMEMNKSGKKWSPDITGGMSHHAESMLMKNEQKRTKATNLVNRSYNEVSDGKDAMKEIMDRKKMRGAAFMEMKKKEYNFGENDNIGNLDMEGMAIAQPFAMAEAKKHMCKGAGCPVCEAAKRKDAEFREWSTEKRKSLKEGKVKGEFAGPNMSFPIAGPQDVSAAWSSVGRAPNPRSVMSKIISIAKKHGWESGLPASVKQRLAAGESGLPS
jgi:hypothetical protein